jgi:hypothetical protein
VVRCPPLEQDGGLPEEYRGWQFSWATETFWVEGFICLWAAAGVGGDLQLHV